MAKPGPMASRRMCASVVERIDAVRYATRPWTQTDERRAEREGHRPATGRCRRVPPREGRGWVEPPGDPAAPRVTVARAGIHTVARPPTTGRASNAAHNPLGGGSPAGRNRRRLSTLPEPVGLRNRIGQPESGRTSSGPRPRRGPSRVRHGEIEPGVPAVGRRPPAEDRQAEQHGEQRPALTCPPRPEPIDHEIDPVLGANELVTAAQLGGVVGLQPDRALPAR
jgi:hypothetical protein